MPDRLLLTPQDPTWVPQQTDSLLCALEEAGLIGEPYSAADGIPAWKVGERFLQLLIFMGCSPHIEVEPPKDGGAFCHLRLDGPLEHPRFLIGRNTTPPRCPQCRTRIGDWRERLRHDATEEWTTWRCEHCGHEALPVAFDWRRNAGGGRIFLEITQIFPSEAVPSDELLALLSRVSGAEWRYFYIQSG